MSEQAVSDPNSETDSARTSLLPLPKPSDGLLARLALIESAQHSLDIQYYLWASDAVGYLLLNRLISAADRDVRVRLLVDDLKLRRRSRSIASLGRHPNLEIRVFNPWTNRSSAFTQGVEAVRRFGRLDHRMHNKLLVADNSQAIVGGRNVADEHFGLADSFALVDFDVLLSGTQVAELSNVFETYWNSPASSSGTMLAKPSSRVELSETLAYLTGEYQQRIPTLSTVLGAEETWGQQAEQNRRTLDEGAVHITSDAPGITTSTRPTQVIEALQSVVDGAADDLVIITPFFVPSDADIGWYRRMVDRGVRIRVLTNSLASNAGTISNSGLKQRRPALLQAGIELFELRIDAAVKSEWEIPPKASQYLGLHAKLYVIDGERVFLGSVNLDPRSKFINTEVGVLVNESRLAQETIGAFEKHIAPENAWRVEVGRDGKLLWRSDTRMVRHQPARSAFQRAADSLLGLLPIKRYI